MKVTLLEMHSLRDCLRAMYLSKRSWNDTLEDRLSEDVEFFLDRNGKPIYEVRFPDTPCIYPDVKGLPEERREEYVKKLEEERKWFIDTVSKLFKWGQKHPTLLRFLDISVMVEGLHRGATDDFDSHARRLDNRIIRSSTRLAKFGPEEMSSWYQGKIIPTEAIFKEGELPEMVTGPDGEDYVFVGCGYVKKGLENDKDVLRGLYRLSIPMNFTFKCSIPELAHIYRERGSKAGGAKGVAAPELQEMMESLMDQVSEWYPWISREYLLSMEI